MLCNITSLQMHPLKALELISYSLIACILQSECYKVGCLLPSWNHILPSTLGVASDPGGLWKSCKIYENQLSFQYLKKLEKVSPRSPKDIKITPKTTSPTPNH